jgi:hypothetical protein
LATRTKNTRVFASNENGPLLELLNDALDATAAGSIALSVLYSYCDNSIVRASDGIDYDDEDDDESDLRTRWTVSSCLALLPIFGAASWFLPQLSVGAWEVEQKSEEEVQRQKRFGAYAVAYLLGYARFGGFDLTRKETWLVALMCFAHAQIESPFGLLKPKRRGNLLSSEGGNKEIDGDGENVDENKIVIEEIASSLKSSLLLVGGANNKSNLSDSSSSSSSSSSKGEERRNSDVIDDRDSAMGAKKSSFAKHLGEYIGELQVQLRNLPMDVQEGRIRAQIEREILATEEMLEKEKSIAADEIEKWDRKWMLRRMKKPELIETCKQNGIKGYSRLNKIEIVELIERFERIER